MKYPCLIFMHAYVCIQIHMHSLFLKNYILLLDIWRFCFSQCLIVPGKLQGKQYCKQGMQGDEGCLALSRRIFYHWNCLSVMVIKGRPTWVTLITVAKFFMNNTPLHCLNLGPPNLHPSSKTEKWPIAVQPKCRARRLQSVVRPDAQQWKRSLQ